MYNECMTKLPQIVEEQLSDTTILILGENYSFLKETIKEQLTLYGCSVDFIASVKKTYDYVLVFGLSKKLTASFVKKNKNYPLHRLKNGGKALVVTNDLEKNFKKIIYFTGNQ